MNILFTQRHWYDHLLYLPSPILYAVTITLVALLATVQAVIPTCNVYDSVSALKINGQPAHLNPTSAIKLSPYEKFTYRDDLGTHNVVDNHPDLTFNNAPAQVGGVIKGHSVYILQWKAGPNQSIKTSYVPLDDAQWCNLKGWNFVNSQITSVTVQTLVWRVLLYKAAPSSHGSLL